MRAGRVPGAPDAPRAFREPVAPAAPAAPGARCSQSAPGAPVPAIRIKNRVRWRRGCPHGVNTVHAPAVNLHVRLTEAVAQRAANQ
eukprot:9497691-Pyramimonas_sp.AAC.1